MAIGNVQYAANVAPNRKRVWYSGTDTLQEGYSLCYDITATEDDTPLNTALGNVVAKPATANLSWYAGAVTAGSAGKTGPCYVEINTPLRGEFVRLFTDAVQSITVTSITYLLPADGTYALDSITTITTDEDVFKFVAVSASADDTDTVNAVSICQWL